MIFSKRTLPSVQGGLMNPAFIYNWSYNTDVSATFRKAREANPSPKIVVLDPLVVSTVLKRKTAYKHGETACL